MNFWLNEWMIEWMNEWLHEWMNDYMNEWLREWMNERWMNDWLHEWLNELMHEWMNEWMKVWMNEWMNERKEERIPSNNLKQPSERHKRPPWVARPPRVDSVTLRAISRGRWGCAAAPRRSFHATPTKPQLEVVDAKTTPLRMRSAQRREFG